MLEDGCGRQVYNLRISVTQECNQRCIYCHREGERKARGKGEGEARHKGERNDGEKSEKKACENGSMSVAEIERAAVIASSLGVFKVKFTGGEPLQRPDLPEIIGKVAPLFKDSSLTTNGTLLTSKAGGKNGGTLAEELRAAGLQRVNISLDSLRPETYRKITGTDKLDDALRGVKAAAEARLVPVKLNMVVLRGLNEDEIPDMMRFAAGNGAVLQLIELEGPKDALSGEWFAAHHADLKHIEEDLKARAEKVTTRRMHHRNKYHVKIGCGLNVEVEIVRPVHNSEFCANCTRMRLNSEGFLVPCLFRRDLAVDLVGPMRRGASDDELRELFRLAVSKREPYWKGDTTGADVIDKKRTAAMEAQSNGR